MPSKQDAERIVKEALQAKVPVMPPCVICRGTTWGIGEYVHLTITRNPATLNLGGSGYPLLPLVCQTCGNTHLLNLLVLGIKDLQSIELPDDGK